MYDALLMGARLLDPASHVDGRFDVAVSAGRIAAIEPRIDPSEARHVEDLTGLVLVPGLVDLHTHVYWGATTLGALPDDACLESGVTATADGGSCGSDGFPGFMRWIVGPSKTKTFCFLNLSRLGLAGIRSAGELVNSAYADPDGTGKLLAEHPEVAVGVKIRVSESVVGGPCLPLLRTAKAVAAGAGRPLMVHIGESVEPIDQVLDELGPGDIITHYQTPKRGGLVDASGQVHPAAFAARERGVLFDCGHGVTHFSFTAARRLLDAGLAPDTISTDISLTSFDQLRPGLATVLNRWLALGVPIADLLPMVTSRAASVLGQGNRLGALAVGNIADLAAFRIEEGAFGHTDAQGEQVTGSERLVPMLTISDGAVVWRADTPKWET